MIIKILKLYFRFLLRIYYKDITVEGYHQIAESDEPMLLVSNHPNALIDALLLITQLKEDLVLTATSSLGNLPFLKGIMERANVKLFYRRMDGHPEEMLAKNQDTISACANVLVEGHKVLIFPEGKSSEDNRLMRFKTGASRIAQNYVEKTGKDLKVVPIYLQYSARDKLRSNVNIKFHNPVPVKKRLDEYQGDFVRQYTEDVRKILEATEAQRNPDDFIPRDKSLKFLDAIMATPFVIFHIIPSLLIFLLAYITTDRKDAYASIFVFASVIVFPIFYTLQIILLLSVLPLLWMVFLLSYGVIFIYKVLSSYVINFGDEISMVN